MIENLILGPGGIYGCSILGAIKYLVKNNYLKDLKCIMGISAGSIIGIFMALKFSYNDIEKLMLKINISKIIDYDNNFMDILDNYGYDDGKKFIRIIKIAIKSVLGNENATFKELYEFSNLEFSVVGSNITNSKETIFNYKTFPDMKIFEAIIISSSIPLVFKPYKFNGDLYLDGGLNSCSTNYYSNQKKTLRLLINDFNDEQKSYNNIFEFLGSLIFYPLRNYRKEVCQGNTIYIKVVNFDNKFVDFGLSDDDKLELVRQGYQNMEDKFINFINFINEKKLVDKSTQTDFDDNDNKNDTNINKNDIDINKDSNG